MIGSQEMGVCLALPSLESPGALILAQLAQELAAKGVSHRLLITRKPCKHQVWRNIAVGEMTREEALEVAKKHSPNCKRLVFTDKLEVPDFTESQHVGVVPFMTWAPVRGEMVEKAWEGGYDPKPMHYRAEVSIPCLDCGEMIQEVVGLWRAQTVKPYIALIDCGSTPEEHAKLEALRGPDLEVHALRFNGVRHPSDFPAIACDLAFSMCRSDVSVTTHSDVFLRRRDVLEELLMMCDENTPAVGYQMTERQHPGWEKVCSHTLSAWWMPKMWEIGAGWSLARLCQRRKIGHWPNSQLRNMPDTEVLLSDILEENGITPRFIGTEENEVQTLDHRIRHVRSLTGARLYAPAHAAKAGEWLKDALEEARTNIKEWAA